MILMSRSGKYRPTYVRVKDGVCVGVEKDDIGVDGDDDGDGDGNDDDENNYLRVNDGVCVGVEKDDVGVEAWPGVGIRLGACSP